MWASSALICGYHARDVLSRFTRCVGLQVIMRLSKGRPPDRVVCIGHSLGGAVAELAALWITSRFPQADIRMVSFGSPRVGNKAFKVSVLHIELLALRLGAW